MYLFPKRFSPVGKNVKKAWRNVTDLRKPLKATLETFETLFGTFANLFETFGTSLETVLGTSGDLLGRLGGSLGPLERAPLRSLLEVF